MDGDEVRPLPSTPVTRQLALPIVMSDPVAPPDGHQAGSDDEKQPQSLKADLALQDAQPTASDKQTPPNNHRRPILHRYSVVGSLAFSAMLVIVGSLQYCIYSRQATIMDKQAKIASDANEQNAIVNRAFVYLKGLNYTFIQAQNDWDLEAMAVWGNSGNTPTTHLYQAVGCPPSIDVLAEPFEAIPWPTEAAPNVYGPKTTENLGGVCNIPAATIGEINARHIHYYFCGVVRYGDTIDRSATHRTEFCYELTGIDRNANRHTGRTVGRHNCADEECPQ
jgi:hypothetical protein